LGQILGVTYAVSAAVAFSTASIFIKISLSDIRNPLLINGLRALFASIIYIPILALWGFGKICLVTFLLLLASAVIGPGIGDITFILAIDRLGAGSATVLAYQYILIAQALNIIVLHDLRGFTAIWLTPLALLGMYLMIVEEGFKKNVSGIALSYIAAVSWAIATLLTSDLVNNYPLTPVQVAGTRVLMITLILLPLSKELGPINVTRKAVQILAASGTISYFLGFVMFTESLQYLGVMIPSLATSLSPMLTQVITIKVLHEELTPKKAIGSALITSSLIFTVIFTNIHA